MTSPYMPLFVAEYLADTAHLTAAEHGAYLMLIMNYWQRGKALPAEDRKLARIARMSDAEWADARDTLAEFFHEEEGEWRHKRIERELSVAAEKSAKAKASARASVESRKANVERPLNERSTDAELLGEVRIEKKEVVVDAPASAWAGEPVQAACLEASGLTNDPNASLWPIHPIAACIDGGASLDLDVIPTIRRMTASGQRPRSWKYFQQAIMDAMAERLRPAPEGRATGPPRHHRPPDGRDVIRFAAHFPESHETTSRSPESIIPPPRLLAGRSG